MRIKNEKLKKNSGITLMSLAIIIIVFLILASITIATIFNNNSVIDRAKEAKEETQIATFKEKLNLAHANAMIEKGIKGSITIEEYAQILKENQIISDTSIPGSNINEPYKNDEGNDVYEVNTDDGFTFDIIIEKNEEDGTDKNITTDNVRPTTEAAKPRIGKIEITGTGTNSIAVKVTVSKLEDGKLSYYYKKTTEPDSSYKALKENTTDLTANFTGLEQNVEYNIKVVATNSKGSHELVISSTTGELPSGTISQKGTTTWNPTTHTASIELETTTTGYTIQYQIGGTSGTWKNYTGPITDLNNGDKVYAVIYDGSNRSEPSIFTIEDKTAPTVTVTPETANTTTSSIKVNVTSKDDQGGMPASPTYKYYIKKSSDANYPADASHTGTQTSHTFTGLVQNTSYDVKVTTVDKANNQGEGKATGMTTGKVGGATGDLTTGNITAGTVTWNPSTHKASVTLSTSTNLTIQYKIGEDGTWTPATGTTLTAGKDVTVTNLNHNNLVYARLIDDAGNYGDEAFMTILDGQAPTVTVTPETANTTTSSIKVNVTSKDDQGGMPASPTYKYYIKKSSDANYPADASHTGTQTSHTFTGLVQNTSYDVKVTTVDKANNLGEGKATGIKTETVGGATGDLTTGNITAGTVTWNPSTHKASVTLSTSTDLTIQYKIGEDGTWTPATGTTATAGKDVTVTNLNHNNLVYARLIDDAGNYGDEAFMTILDGQAPTVTVTPETASTTTSSIKVNVTSKDDQGGMPTSPTYNYYIKKSSDANYPEDASHTGTQTSHTFTGLVQNTSYDVKVTTVDKANNLGEGKATGMTTGKVGGATGNLTSGNVTAGTVTWNPSTHKASVTLETTTNLTIQYKIGESGTWTPATGTTLTAGKDVTVTNLSLNDLVYARLIDDAGNYGDEAFMTISDGQAPTVTVTPETASTTTSSIKVNVTSKDDQGGMPTSPTYKYYIKKSSDANYQADAEHTGTQTSHTFTGLVQNTSYDVKVTTVDKANNLGEGKAEGITTLTVGGATGNLTSGNVTAGTVTWNKDTHKASVTLSTNTDLTIQYKIGEDGTWTPATGTTATAGKDVTVTNLNHNNLVYARLIDEAGNYGDEAFMTILDGQAPTVTVTPETASTTTSSIKVNVTSKDDQGGMPTSPTYKYYIKKSSDANYPEDASHTGTQTSHTFTGLVQNTSYDVKVTTVDKANNLGEGTATGMKTGIVGGASSGLQTGNITAGTPEWTNGTASITLATTTDLTIQWQKVAQGATMKDTWTEYTGAITGLKHGETIYARLWDGVNAGSEASISILDGLVPSQATIELSSKEAYPEGAITATVTHADNESGIAEINCKWIYNTTSEELGTTNAEWNTADAFSTNPEAIELTATTPGTYYLHVLSVDNGGNKTEKVSEAITIKQPVTAITLDQTAATIKTEETLQLTATIVPDDASNKEVTWSTSDENLATVSDTGLVTAKAVGTVTITVKSKDGSNKTATCEITIQQAGTSAEDIVNKEDKDSIYGKIVTNYTVGDRTLQSDLNADGIKWKIFYAGSDFSADGSNHIYLIADNYIPYANIPKTKGGNSLPQGIGASRIAYWNSTTLNDYTGSESITDDNIKKLNHSYFSQGYSSTYDKWKAIAYMLDTNAWGGYKGSKADYAVGGPTIELLMKSYSQKHGVDYQAKADEIGYGFSTDGGLSWKSYYLKCLDTSDSLYVLSPHSPHSDAGQYWIASPARGSDVSELTRAAPPDYFTGVCIVKGDGGSIELREVNVESAAFRPLVCLSSYVELEKQADGNYKIKEPELPADGSYSKEKGVNTPNLSEDMTPIKWDETANDWIETTGSDPEWYDYTSAEKKWANAKTSDGSMWVWIPRYAYQIADNYHNGGSGISGTINIKFMKGTTDEASDGTNTWDNASGEGNWNIHPGFEYSETLPGIWVAKFEASHTGCTTDPATGETDTDRTDLTLQVKPGITSWRNISIGNAYTVCLNYNTNLNSHMMKNSEWGAVAYLSQSSYGKNSEIWINSNSDGITGSCGNSVSASAYDYDETTDYTEGVNASTTGNIYGIYDMSGGSGEYVAGYIENGGSLTEYGASLINGESYTKDIYEGNAENDSATNYSINSGKYGDAVYETSAGTDAIGELYQSWYGDLSTFSLDNFGFFLNRGGSSAEGEAAGVYGFVGIYRRS